MIVVHCPTVLGDEGVGIAQRRGDLPQVRLQRYIRVALQVDLLVGVANHVHDDDRLGCDLQVSRHVTGADAPLPAVEATVILSVKKGQPDLTLQLVPVQRAGQFQQNRHAGRPVVGAHHGNARVLLIGAATGVVVSAHHDHRPLPHPLG